MDIDGSQERQLLEKLSVGLKIFMLPDIFKNPENFKIESVKERIQRHIRSLLHSDQIFDSIQLQVMVSALNLPYADPKQISDHFVTTINSHMSKWDPAVFCAPYVSLVQSSGCGKTRLLKQVTELGVYVVYLNLRSADEGGVPPHIPFSRTFIDWRSEAKYSYYLVTMLEKIVTLRSELNCTPDAFFERCLDASFWVDVAVSVEKYCMSGIKDLQGRFEELLKSIPGESDKLKVLFAFDEARHLVNDKEDPSKAKKSSFAELRRALGQIPSASSIFAVLTDTFSKVSYFSPANHRDPSFKVKRKGEKLFPPYFFGNMDLANPLKLGRRIPDGWMYVDINSGSTQLVPFSLVATLKEVGTLKHLVRYGRPLWISTFLSATKQYKKLNLVEAFLIDLARSKMLGGIDFNLWPETSRIAASESSLDENVFALLSCVYDISANLESHAIETMVASYMCVLGFVSDDRQYVLGKYASEPILVEGAAQCLWKLGVKQALDQYLCSLSLLSAGETGEFVARFILLYSLQRKLSPKNTVTNTAATLFYFSQKVTLSTYFESLFVPKQFREVKKNLPADLLSGYVCFSHFRRLNHLPTVDHLRDAFSRSMAIICTENATGVDLVIPICLTTDTNAEITELNMSAVLVQVKNRSITSFETEKKIGLDKVDVNLAKDVPYVSMIMSIRNVHSQNDFSVAKDENQTHILVESFDHYSIFDGVDGKLLKETCVSIVDHRHSIAERYEPGSIDLELAAELYPAEYDM